MKISEDLQRKIVSVSLGIAIFLNFVIENIIFKKIIMVVYVLLLFSYSIYTFFKNRPISKHDKIMLIIATCCSILIFIYAITL